MKYYYYFSQRKSCNTSNIVLYGLFSNINPEEKYLDIRSMLRAQELQLGIMVNNWTFLEREEFSVHFRIRFSSLYLHSSID